MKRFLALDFETSGLDPKRHQPTEIGLALFEDGEVIATYESLIGIHKHYKTGRPTREFDAVALAISGRTMEELESAPSPLTVCREVSAWAREHEVTNLWGVCFNTTFDWPRVRELAWLGSEYDRAAGGPVAPDLCLPHRWACAYELACRRLSLEAYRLDNVAAHFGLSRTKEKHGALEDAILVGKVYHALTTKVEVGV